MTDLWLVSACSQVSQPARSAMHSSSAATQHPVPFTCDTQVFTCFKPLQLNVCPLFEKAMEQKKHLVLGHQSCTRSAAHLCLLRPCLLPAMPWHRAPPQLLWAYAEAVHDDICPQVKTLCVAGCGQKEKKKKKITSLKQAVLQLSNLPSRVYTAYHTVPWEKQLYSSNPIPLPACHKYHTATESGTWLVSRILFTCAWALQQNKSTRNQQLHDSSAECNSPPSCYLKAGRKDSWKDAHLNILLCGYFWNDISCSPLVAKPCK